MPGALEGVLQGLPMTPSLAQVLPPDLSCQPGQLHPRLDLPCPWCISHVEPLALASRAFSGSFPFLNTCPTPNIIKLHLSQHHHFLLLHFANLEGSSLSSFLVSFPNLTSFSSTLWLFLLALSFNPELFQTFVVHLTFVM